MDANVRQVDCCSVCQIVVIAPASNCGVVAVSIFPSLPRWCCSNKERPCRPPHKRITASMINDAQKAIFMTFLNWKAGNFFRV